MKTTKFFSMVAISLLLSSNIMAQHNGLGNCKSDTVPQISQETRDKMASLHKAHQEQTKPLHDKLAALMANHHSLMNTLNPDFTAIKKNIEEVSNVKKELSAKSIDHGAEIKKLLPADFTPGKMMMQHRQQGNNFGNGMMGKMEQKQGRNHANKSQIGQHQNKRDNARKGNGDGQKMERRNKNDHQMGMQQGDRKVNFEKQGRFSTMTSIPELSDDQKAQIKKIRVDNEYNNSQIENKIAELKVKQRTLITAKNPDTKAIKSTNSSIIDLEKEMMLNNAKARIDAMNVLPEDIRKAAIAFKKG